MIRGNTSHLLSPIQKELPIKKGPGWISVKEKCRYARLVIPFIEVMHFMPGRQVVYFPLKRKKCFESGSDFQELIESIKLDRPLPIPSKAALRSKFPGSLSQAKV